GSLSPTTCPPLTLQPTPDSSTPHLNFVLAALLRLPVLNMTGLKGRYDFVLDITTFMPQQHGPAPAPGEGQPAPMDPVSILQIALPQQLGLKLESRKMPIEMLVIDHIEKAPTEN